MADLDRLVTLTIRGPHTRDENNRAVPGPITFQGQIWARYDDLGSGTEVGSGGILQTISYRNFMIRYRADMVDISPLTRIDVADDESREWALVKIGEPDRRRFMELECTRAA